MERYLAAPLDESKAALSAAQMAVLLDTSTVELMVAPMAGQLVGQKVLEKVVKLAACSAG